MLHANLILFIIYAHNINNCSFFIILGVGTTSNNTYIIDSVERRHNALLILKYMCENNILTPHLRELLTAKYVKISIDF